MAYEIFHFTHIDNFPGILGDGGLLSDALNQKKPKPPTRSGDKGIKTRRLTWELRPRAGKGKHVGDYVPFYLAPRSPMLFKISTGTVEGVRPDQDGLVYLVGSSDDFRDYVVTDGNAAHGSTTCFTGEEGFSKVDWEVIRADRWNNTNEDTDRMRRRMAEFLVHEKVAWEKVRRLVTRVEKTKKHLEQLFDKRKLKHRPPIEVNPAWYY